MVKKNDSPEINPANKTASLNNNQLSTHFTKIITEKKNESQKILSLNEISMIIVPDLSKMFKEGKFQNKVSNLIIHYTKWFFLNSIKKFFINKEIFKKMAKKIAHFLLMKNMNESKGKILKI